MVKSLIKTLALVVYVMPFGSANADTYIETIAQISRAADGLALDSSGNVYGASYSKGTIYKIDQDRNVSILLEPNTGGSAGMRFDAQNNLYVAMYNQNRVLKISADGTHSTFTNNIQEPIGLDWDSEGNLYVSSFAGSPSISKIAADGTKTAIADITQIHSLSSLAIDDEDNVYVTSYKSGDIYKVDANGTVSLFVSTGAIGFGFIQYDKTNQKFYATIAKTSELYEFDRFGNYSVLIQTPQGGATDGLIDEATIDEALGLAISDDGNSVYFATQSHIRRLSLNTSFDGSLTPYFTSMPLLEITEDQTYTYQLTANDSNGDALQIEFPTLPDWLTFDQNDTISGIPNSSHVGNQFSVEATVTDGTNSIKQSFQILVNEKVMPPPPVASSGSGAFSIVFLLLFLVLLTKREFNLLKPQYFGEA